MTRRAAHRQHRRNTIRTRRRSAPGQGRHHIRRRRHVQSHWGAVVMGLRKKHRAPDWYGQGQLGHWVGAGREVASLKEHLTVPLTQPNKRPQAHIPLSTMRIPLSVTVVPGWERAAGADSLPSGRRLCCGQRGSRPHTNAQRCSSREGRKKGCELELGEGGGPSLRRTTWTVHPARGRLCARPPVFCAVKRPPPRFVEPLGAFRPLRHLWSAVKPRCHHGSHRHRCGLSHVRHTRVQVGEWAPLDGCFSVC